MTTYFVLSSDADLSHDGRLTSYSGTIRGGKLVLTLKIEVEGWRMHSALEALETIQRAHKRKPAAPKPKPEPKPKAAKPLALPAPALALPRPEDL